MLDCGYYNWKLFPGSEVPSPNLPWKVDRIWSIVPFVYCWLLASRPVWIPGEKLNERLVIMTFLCTFWGLRLSYNFWRKGKLIIISTSKLLQKGVT